MAEQQSLQHHTKWVPAFHGFVVPVLVLNISWSVGRLVHMGFSFEGMVRLLTALALLVLAFCARLFALSVQDRVIRLEERLRLERLSPETLKPRIGEFTTDQLVAMRFASDGELPTLAAKVLNDKVTQRKAVKKLIQTWRPDHQRA